MNGGNFGNNKGGSWGPGGHQGNRQGGNFGPKGFNQKHGGPGGPSGPGGPGGQGPARNQQRMSNRGPPQDGGKPVQREVC